MAQKTVIGNLQVRLTAITDGFTKSMFKASDGLRTFARVANTDVLKAIPKLAGNLTGLLANAFLSIPRLIAGAISSMMRFAKVIGVTVAAAATTAAASLIYLTKQSFAAIDALRVQAVKLDVSTKFLSVLGVAADGAGVSFETATGAITKATRAISDAAIKGGAARDALKEIGLSAYDLIRLKPDEQFLKISEALGKVSNQSDKVRIAVALFGKAGAEVLPLFAENMEEAQKWARIMNLEISDFDAAQIDAAGDKVNLLSKGFKGIGNYLATTLAPIITGLADKLLNLIAANGGIAAIVESTISAVTQRSIALLNNLGGAIEQVRNFVGNIGISPQAVGGGTDKIFQFIANMVRQSSVAANAISGIFETLKAGILGAAVAALKIVDLFFAGIQKIDAALGRVSQSGDVGEQFRAAYADIVEQTKISAALAAGYFSDAFNGVNPSIEAAAQQIEALGNTAGEVAEKGAESFKKYSIKVEDGLQNLNQGALMQYLDMLKQIVSITNQSGEQDARKWFETHIPGGIGDGPSDKIFSFTDKVAKQQETLADEVTRIWARTADSISDSLAEALTSGEDAFKSLLKVALDVANQILSAFLNKAFIGPLIGGLTGGGGNVLGGPGNTMPSTPPNAESVTSGVTESAPRSDISSGIMAGALAGGGGTTVIFNMYGPVSSQTEFRRMAIDALTDPRAQSIIKGTSYENTTKNLKRQNAPLGGR